MIKFEKITIVRQNKYDIEFDSTLLVLDFFKNESFVNYNVILSLTYGTERYSLDLGRLISYHPNIGTSTIDALIGQLTPEMIYSFGTNFFHQPKMIRSFMSNDLPGTITVAPYNITTGETTNIIYDTAYKDMVITCDEFDLTNVIPIINDKIRKCSWYNKQICLEGRSTLTQETDIISFLSFESFDINIHTLQSIIDNECKVPENKSFILILDGKIFYDANYIFNIDYANTLILNELFIMSMFKEFASFEDLVNSDDTFLIEIDVAQIYIRDLLIMQLDNTKTSVFKYFEKVSNYNHIDYICIDNSNESIHGLTSIDDQYKNVAISIGVYEHHVYIQNGNTDMRLIQMSGY